jgi:hypothetical protein
MERPPYFAETAAGAVILISIQFLSLPGLVAGLLLLGIGRFVRSRSLKTK